MTKGWKIVALVLALATLVGVGYMVGKGKGATEQTVSFAITVKPSGLFELAITPTDVECVKGDTLTFTLTNTPSGGYDAQIQYTLGGLPDGSYTFSKNPVNAGEASTITVNTALLTSNSTYTCSVTGVDY